MNESMQATGELRSTPTATAADTGTTDGAGNEAGKITGSMAASSKTLPKDTVPSTKRKRNADPLPLVDLLSILQDTMHNLQAAGLQLSAVNLPVPAGQPPRVALILEGVVFDTGNLSLSEV
jgi:hypothetical protein